MKKNVLSVIIPMYNMAQYIKDCLASIVAQDRFPEFQVIVIDDGSVDMGAKIVQEYVQQYPNIELYQQKNLGVSVARNRGLDVAHGEYISFVDADDMVGAIYEKCQPYMSDECEAKYSENMVYKSGKLKTQMPKPPLGDKQYFARMIDAAHDSKAEIVMGGKICDQGSLSLMSALTYDKSQTFYDTPHDKRAALTQAYDRESANFAIYRRDFLNQYNLQFEPDMPLDEDILFCMLAVLHAKKIATVCDSLYYYKKHAGSLTDYVAIMPIWMARSRMSAALVQLYGTLLQELNKYPQYHAIKQDYMREFAGWSADGDSSHLEYFPRRCYFCKNKTCEQCEHSAENFERISNGIKHLMPNKILYSK